MTELTPVPVASVAGMIFSLILSIGLPIALLVFLRNRTGARVSAFLIGGATFFVSAMVLEQLLHSAVVAAQFIPLVLVEVVVFLLPALTAVIAVRFYREACER